MNKVVEDKTQISVPVFYRRFLLFGISTFLVSIVIFLFLNGLKWIINLHVVYWVAIVLSCLVVGFIFATANKDVVC